MIDTTHPELVETDVQTAARLVGLKLLEIAEQCVPDLPRDCALYTVSGSARNQGIVIHDRQGRYSGACVLPDWLTDDVNTLCDAVFEHEAPEVLRDRRAVRVRPGRRMIEVGWHASGHFNAVLPFSLRGVAPASNTQ